MRGNGVIDGIPAQEIAPKGGGMVAIKLRRRGLLNGRECVRGCGGPQLGQARGAVGFVYCWRSCSSAWTRRRSSRARSAAAARSWACA
jgi:hypothetical protein